MILSTKAKRVQAGAYILSRYMGGAVDVARKKNYIYQKKKNTNEAERQEEQRQEYDDDSRDCDCDCDNKFLPLDTVSEHVLLRVYAERERERGASGGGEQPDTA